MNSTQIKKNTTTGQILTIQIANQIAEVTHEISPSAVITLTRYATLVASQWQTRTLATYIDHIEGQVEHGTPITATFDGQGNWSVALKRCTMPTSLAATAVAQDGTRVIADFTLCGPVAMPTTPELPRNGRLDKFFFLPIIAVGK